MTEVLEGGELEKVYKYDVSVEVRNILGDRLGRVFPKVRASTPQEQAHLLAAKSCVRFGAPCV